MSIKDSLKKILPLPAASTRNEFSKAKNCTDKVNKKLDRYAAEVESLGNIAAQRFQSLEEAVSAASKRLNTIEFQVNKCRQSSEYNGTRIEHLGKAIGGTATRGNLNEIKSELCASGKAAIAVASASMGRFMLEHLDYHIVDHCNLNCACCSTYSPIAPKRFVEVGVFESDLARLHELVGDKVLRLHILGGEPLLHPELVTLLEIARGIFSDSRIDVTTNGLLVSTMEDCFWDAMKRNRIDLKYTQYPVNVDYDAMTEAAAGKGIFAYSAGGGEINYFRRIPLNPKGTSSVNATYMQCPYIDCPQLKDGKLFRCPASAYADILNKALGDSGKNTSFHVSKLDYIDLGQDLTEQDIFEFLSRPIPFCQYCDMSNIDNCVEWGHSTKNINEWVDV